ncbi:MAG: DUF3093 domain-containing protein [Haloechinothrix sp.]
MTQSSRGPIRYSERLALPWWAWPLPLVAAAILAAEIHMGYSGIRGWLPYAVLVPLTTAVLLSLGRTRIRVAGEADEAELWVGDAHLPLRFVGRVEVIDRKDKRKAMGPGLDPAAYLMHRGWIGQLVRVHLTDDRDPTPYWLFSTRRPERVAELLRTPSSTR